ncbi:MAG TPA: hypothetical protein VK660_00455, partial [Xanthomonadaceae bacterium]|nr:hypothetical protein [Xanthomonadaceae bacterium]
LAILMMAFVAVVVLPQSIDRWFGARLNPLGKVASTLRWIIRRLNPIGASRAVTPLMLTITTNMRGKNGFVVFLLLLYVLMTSVSVSEVQRRDPSALSWSGLLPKDLQEQQTADSYESSPASALLVPRIQNDIVTDPYLRLWVPLDQKRLRAFTTACGKLKPVASTRDERARTTREQAFSACLGSVFAPRMDGVPIAGLHWRFFRDSARGVDGLHAYIPVQQLATGEHELTVNEPARDDNEPDAYGPSWRIPFWR